MGNSFAFAEWNENSINFMPILFGFLFNRPNVMNYSSAPAKQVEVEKKKVQQSDPRMEFNWNFFFCLLKRARMKIISFYYAKLL